MNRADLIILGGGPAGTSAAITAAVAGLRVVLLESLEFPRDRPGETLHPGTESLLAQLGVCEEISRAKFLRHRGHYVKWGNNQEFVEFGADGNGTWQGFQAWRSTFDAILLNRARKLGVKVYQPCRAVKPILEGKTVVGAETSKGNFFGKFLLDAAGGRHWLAKHLNIKINLFTPQLIARYGYLSSGCLCSETPSLTADENGWTWTAEVQPGLFNLSRLSFNEPSRASDFFPVRLKKLFGKKAVRGSDVSWRVASAPAGAGYFLVGDAASVLDPVSSHGVLKALMSGIMTGYLIVQTQAGKLSADQAAVVYSRWILDWFFKDAEKLVELYKKLSSPPFWLQQTAEWIVEKKQFANLTFSK